MNTPERSKTKKIVPLSDDEIQYDDEPENRGDDDEEYYEYYEEEGKASWLENSQIYQYIRMFLSSISYNCLKSTLRWFMDSASLRFSFSFEDILLLMTVFVLFGVDILYLTLPKSADAGFSIAYAICLFTFIFEFLANNWCKTTFESFFPLKFHGYFLSFFFFLDLLSILSLFPDVDFIAKPLGIGNLSDNISGSSNYTQAGRVVRLVRLVRLVRIYKIGLEKRKRAKLEEELFELLNAGYIQYEDLQSRRALFSERQSKLGTQLSESTTRRVIVIILILIIVIPLLIYSPANEAPEFAVEMLQTFNLDNTVSQAARQTLLDATVTGLVDANYARYIGYLQVSPTFGDSPVVLFSANLDHLRDVVRIDHTERFVNSTGTEFITKAIYNFNGLLFTTAYYEIILTVFVAIMLVGGAVVFTSDADRLVIAPIERMMNMVDAVAENPLANIHFEDNNLAGSAGEYETKLLESTISKITGLLRVGFGEAGAGIISANLSSQGSAAINPLLPGVRIYAIFGFCDIHHFEDINQLLSNDVLTFVNTIANIVHNSVHTWAGQCNKNLGNAFVIVWRIGDETSLIASTTATNRRSAAINERNTFSQSMQGKSSANKINKAISNDENEDEVDTNPKKQAQLIDLRRIPGVDVLADKALIGYLKIIAEINRDKAVLNYRKEPRLTNNHKEDFKVRMGFGLHAGWAIEGAVGSLQKVDATYLSPHVNMAARLETSSKQYGVPLLASQDFYDLLSSEAQAYCRRLDVVTVKGSEVPIGIYTYDALQDQEFRENRAPPPITPFTPKPTSLKRKPSFSSRSDSGSALNSPSSGSRKTLALTSGNSSNNNNNDNSSNNNNESANNTPFRKPSLTLHPGQERSPIFMSPDSLTADVFENDCDMIILRQHVSKEFLDTFKDGVVLYLNGDWKSAKEILEKADLLMSISAPILGGDGPSQTLLSYMKERDYTAPKSWKGYRPLTSK